MDWEDVSLGQESTAESSERTFASAIQEYLATTCVFAFTLTPLIPISQRHYTDQRTWKRRQEALHSNWEPIIDSLVDAFISWKHPDQLNTSLPPHDPTYDFEIEVIDIFSPSATAVISRLADSTSVSVALVNAGYLGTTPLVPSLAVSLKTLQLFHTIRMHRASFSVEAFAKVVCHWNKVR